MENLAVCIRNAPVEYLNLTISHSADASVPQSCASALLLLVTAGLIYWFVVLMCYSSRDLIML